MPSEFFTLSASGPVQIVALNLLHVVDGSELDKINDELAAVVGAKPAAAWVLDLTKVEYTGSAVLGVIVNFRQYVKQSDGRLMLCGMSQRLMEIFKTCSLDRLFTTVGTRAQAVKGVS